MQTPRIVILGPQGAGKGTQAGRLARRLHIPHISAGDLLREEIHRGTALGKEIARVINAGNMMPDRMMSAVIRKRLKVADARRGWILDGYPRYIKQAKTFKRFAKPNAVIHLHLTDAQAVRRLSGRRVCPKGHIYHTRHDQPKKRRGYCDHDGLKLVQRDDDTPNAIRHRLQLYHDKTEPLIHYYRDQGLVVTVDAHPSIPRVYRSMLNKLKKFSWLSSLKKKS